MTNIRLKKGDNHNRNKEEVSEKETVQPKDEPFPDATEDELTRKRKMILTGITAGVAVAGASAAALLFFGPYSPFGVKQTEKPVNLAKETKPIPPSQPEVAPVIVPHTPEHTTPPVLAVAPIPQVAREAPHKVTATPKPKETPPPQVAIAPLPPKPIVKETKQNTPVPVENDNKESSGPDSYNYNIQDGGPIISIPANKKVQISRDPSFKTIYLNGVPASDGKYRISVPPPGEVYWKEEGKAARKLTILPPIPSGLRADIPPQLKLTDRLVWTSTGKVSFYRVEVASDAEFTNKLKTFSTVKTSLPANALGQGKWFIKISALNLQSGVWDSTKSIPLSIEEDVAPVKKVEEKPVEAEAPKSEATLETPEPTEPVKPIEPRVEQPASDVKPDSGPVPPVVEE
ncbi:hypothetical protein [Fluviispira multicolorata]|uniref:Uncharacterized protein n=1 Tax=Fluviispira multicolorata TaxID=2654512 RepID=A0A833JE25_9BACT|nr:hypothetical protein [Fluviispira multicolorata]KAB8032160.1 hypothetical protein GCL57_05805 [Fluviispira multicolorata]